MSTGRFFLAACLCAATLTSIACSENPARLMPSGPSPIQSAASSSDLNITSGAALQTGGVVQDSAVVAAWASQVGWAAADFEAEGAGEITAKTGSCPTVTFTILGVPVTTNSSTSFVHGACEDLATERRVNVRAVLVNTGGVLSVTAKRVEFQGDNGGRRRVDGEGTVANLTGTCPNLRMVIHGIHVSTNASTVFESGECGNLRNGTKVRIEGETDGDRSLVATRVLILDQPGGRPVEGEGNVGGVHGTCPTLTMVVSGHPVMTTSSTVFTGGVCTDVRPGSRIFVRGTIEGGSVLATEVEIRSRP
jgi:hypothetical protein